MSKEKRTFKIVINRGEEFQIRQGCVYEKDGFFYDSYQKGAGVVNALFTKSGVSQAGFDCCAPGEQSDYDFRNNIIAFCAGRGGGKSSALRTFTHALEHLHEEKQRCSEEDVKAFWGENVRRKYFTALPVIDPTMMQKQDAFMRIILSRMFAQLRQKWGEGEKCGSEKYYSQRVTENEQTQILRGFRHCYRSLDAMYKAPTQNDVYDDLEEMAALGDSANFKAEFRELVKLYLRQMLPGQKDACMIIQIDDADLNIEKAHDILDDVSKYCILPEVLVLMATNMEQTMYVMEQYYIEQFGKLIDTAKKYGETSIYRKAHTMAARYIDKVIPSNHQIHLPQISDVLHDNGSVLSLEYVEYKSDPAQRQDLLREQKEDFTGYQERLLRLFYQRTGIVLIKPDSYRHNLLPGQMRELTHFLSFLFDLESVNPELYPARLYAMLNNLHEYDAKEISDAQKELTKRRRNLSAVEQYFLNNWCELNLTGADRKVMMELAGAVGNTISQIMQNYSKDTAERLEAGIDGSDWSVTSLPPAKGSYAGLMNDIQKVVLKAYEEEDYHMLYAVRFFYTLTLHRMRLALLEEKGQWARLTSFVKFDVWVPNYSRISPEFPYGRFAVDLKALQDIEGKNVDLAEKYRGLLFVIFANGSPYAYNTYSAEQLRTTEKDALVVFDMNYMMLDLVCTYEGLYAKSEKTSTELSWRLDWVEAIFQALLGWDVQHYFENRIYTSSDKQNWIWPDKESIIPLAHWVERYYNRLFEQLQKIRYIPCTWPEQKGQKEGFFTNVLKGELQNLPCANLTYLAAVVRCLKENQGMPERQVQTIDLLMPWQGEDYVKTLIEKINVKNKTTQIDIEITSIFEQQEEKKKKMENETDPVSKEKLENDLKQLTEKLEKKKQERKKAEEDMTAAVIIEDVDVENALNAILGKEGDNRFIRWSETDRTAFRALKKNWNGSKNDNAQSVPEDGKTVPPTQSDTEEKGKKEKAFKVKVAEKKLLSVTASDSETNSEESTGTSQQPQKAAEHENTDEQTKIDSSNGGDQKS